MKARADKLDLKIRALHPTRPTQCTWRGPIETSIRPCSPTSSRPNSTTSRTRNSGVRRQRAWESPTPFAYLTLEPDFVELRFIKFNLTSRAYQTKSSPLEGLARPILALPSDHLRVSEFLWQLGQRIRPLTVESYYPSLEVLPRVGGFYEAALQRAYCACRCVEKLSVFQTEPGQVFLI